MEFNDEQERPWREGIGVKKLRSPWIRRKVRMDYREAH
jgi:hypothetical protein